MKRTLLSLLLLLPATAQATYPRTTAEMQLRVEYELAKMDLQQTKERLEKLTTQSEELHAHFGRLKRYVEELRLEIEAEDTNPGQAKSSTEVAEYAMRKLMLTRHDTLAEIGCGDAEHLIAAVERYGCDGVGIEIDPELATQARLNVKAAGLEHKIDIITGDARRVDFSEFDAVYVYVFPDLLEALAPKMKGKRVASPYHEIKGLDGRLFGEAIGKDPVWLYGFDWSKHDRKPHQQQHVLSTHYLVSEPWCSLCPAQKERFLAEGHPEENILSQREFQRRFGFWPPVPYRYELQKTTNQQPVQQQSQRQPVQQQRVAVWNGRQYASPWCNNPNCAMCNSIRRQLQN